MYERGRLAHTGNMNQTAIGHACRRTDEQDLAAQRRALAALGQPADRLACPELSTSQRAHLTKLDAAHGQELSEPAEVFSAGRPRAYRILARQ